MVTPGKIQFGWLALAALAWLILRARGPQSGTLTVKGRTLLGPGLWRTEDWQTWSPVSGPV